MSGQTDVFIPERKVKWWQFLVNYCKWSSLFANPEGISVEWRCKRHTVMLIELDKVCTSARLISSTKSLEIVNLPALTYNIILLEWEYYGWKLVCESYTNNDCYVDCIYCYTFNSCTSYWYIHKIDTDLVNILTSA